jgi:hypothetical protein
MGDFPSCEAQEGQRLRAVNRSCAACGLGIPVEQAFCSACLGKLSHGGAATGRGAPLPGATHPDPLVDESFPSKYDDEYRLAYARELDEWRRHVRSARITGVCLCAPWAIAFLVWRQWPFALLFIVTNWWGWQMIRRAQGTKP